jgi:NADPH:quinone reductase-like Zn-dependent oxidoreductase
VRAVRLHAPGGPEQLVVEELETPKPSDGEAVVRVRAAAITRDELDWRVDHLPAIPSYEFSGVVDAVGPGSDDLETGDAVYALSGFDRDGAAAEYTVVPADYLAPKPQALGHVESAAIPLAALSAWQGLFDHGQLREGEHVLVHGAAGGVGHFAIQLAHHRGAHVLGTASTADLEAVRELGADEVIDHGRTRFEAVIDQVDLVFDTAGGDAVTRSAAFLHEEGRLVSVAAEPPAELGGTYFVVEPNREQLVELARLVDDGRLVPAIDSVFPLEEAGAAFERVASRGKRGKVVLQVYATE